MMNRAYPVWRRYVRDLLLVMLTVSFVSACVVGDSGTGGSGGVTWIKTYGVDTEDLVSNDHANAVLQTDDDGDGQRDDGFLMVGETRSPALRRGRRSPMGQILALKTDGAGSVEWASTMPPPPSFRRLDGAVEGADGNIFAVGVVGEDVVAAAFAPDGRLVWQEEIADIRPPALSLVAAQSGGLVVLGESAANVSDFQVTAINASGAPAWSRQLPGGNPSSAVDIARDTGGGYIVVGSVEQSGVQQAIVFRLAADGSILAGWPRTYGGGRNDRPGAVIATRSGNIVIVGETWSYAIGPDDRCDDASSACPDAWIFMLDPGGNVVWSRSYGGDYPSDVHDVMEAPEGGFLLAGYRWTRPDDEHFTEGGKDEQHLWLLKLDGNGDLCADRSRCWEVLEDSPGLKAAVSVTRAAGDGYVVAALGAEADSGEPVSHLLQVDAAGARDRLAGSIRSFPMEVRHISATASGYVATFDFEGYGAIVSLDNAGEWRWSHLGADEPYRHTYATAVAQGPDGDFYLSGVLSGTGAAYGSFSTDILVIKLSASDGAMIWQQRYDLGGDDFARAIRWDGSGLVLVGESWRPTSEDPEPTAFVVRLDSNGQMCSGACWVQTFAVQEANDVLATGDGYIIGGKASRAWLAHLDRRGELLWQRTHDGSSVLSLAADPSGGIVAGLGTGVGNTFEFRVLRLDQDGRLCTEDCWGVQVGGNSEGLSDVSVAPDGTVMVVGSTTGFGNSGDCGASGCSNVFAVSLDPAGSVQWQRTYSTAANDRAFGVQATSDGGLIVAGETRGVTDAYDVWAMKLGPDGKGANTCALSLGKETDAAVSSLDPDRDGDADEPSLGTLTPQVGLISQRLLTAADMTITRQCYGGFDPDSNDMTRAAATAEPTPASAPSQSAAPTATGAANAGSCGTTLFEVKIDPAIVNAYTNGYGEAVVRVARRGSFEGKLDFVLAGDPAVMAIADARFVPDGIEPDALALYIDRRTEEPFPEGTFAMSVVASGGGESCSAAFRLETRPYSR